MKKLRRGTVVLVTFGATMIWLMTPALAAKGRSTPAPLKAPVKQELEEKIPKSLFLIKKARVDSGVGEPQFYPADAQLRTIIDDAQLGQLKKFQ